MDCLERAFHVGQLQSGHRAVWEEGHCGMEAGERALLIVDQENVDDEYKAPVIRMLPRLLTDTKALLTSRAL